MRWFGWLFSLFIFISVLFQNRYMQSFQVLAADFIQVVLLML